MPNERRQCSSDLREKTKYLLFIGVYGAQADWLSAP
jgi:hypothetical protein